jgi:hypothetical protein
LKKQGATVGITIRDTRCTSALEIKPMMFTAFGLKLHNTTLIDFLLARSLLSQAARDDEHSFECCAARWWLLPG